MVICAFRGRHPDPSPQYGRFVRTVFPAGDDLSEAVAPIDDWPFLYLSHKTIPADYMIVIGILLAITIPAVFVLRGRGFGMNDGHFLFLGLGFLLLETKSISDCSLYFGTTRFVTLVVRDNDCGVRTQRRRSRFCVTDARTHFLLSGTSLWNNPI